MRRKASRPLPYPGVTLGISYAEPVVLGEISVCRYAQQACERFLRDLTAAQAGKSSWEFRPERAEAPIARERDDQQQIAAARRVVNRVAADAAAGAVASS